MCKLLCCFLFFYLCRLLQHSFYNTNFCVSLSYPNDRKNMARLLLQYANNFCYHKDEFSDLWTNVKFHSLHTLSILLPWSTIALDFRKQPNSWRLIWLLLPVVYAAPQFKICVQFAFEQVCTIFDLFWLLSFPICSSSTTCAICCSTMTSTFIIVAFLP